jgi:sugar phosphate permease
LELQFQGRREPLLLMASVSVVIFAVHSLVETPIYSPTVLALLLIILGFSNIKARDEKLA